MKIELSNAQLNVLATVFDAAKAAQDQLLADIRAQVQAQMPAAPTQPAEQPTSETPAP